MPLPNSSNRLQFKEYLRSNREKFTSGVQTCVLGDIQSSILSISSGIDTSQVTRVILFDNNEVVGLSTVLSQQQLFYVPALPDDSIIIGVGTALDNQYRLDFVGDGQGIKFGDQIFGLDDVIGLGTDVSLIVKGLGGGLFQPDNPPTYTVGTSSTSVLEGGSVSVTVNTTNVGSGTTLFYNIIGNVDSADFSDNVTAGSFIVSNGIGTVTKTIANDLDENEGIEAFAVRIAVGSSTGQVVGTSSTIFITDVGLPSATITPSATSVNEGSSVSFTVNTVNVTTPGSLYYSTGGSASAADFTDDSLTGSFNVVSTGSTTGVGTFTRTLKSEQSGSEGSEDFNITVRSGSTSGIALTTTPSITINDVVASYSITPSTTNVEEGNSVTFTVNTVNVATPTTLYYSTGGTATAEDFSNNLTTGSFTVNYTGPTTGSGTIVRSIATDAVLDGDETFNISVRAGSESGTIVATSSDVTIGDVAPTYSITPDVLNVDEGGSVVFTATSTLSTQTLYYTVTSPNNALTDADFISSPTSGSLNITNGSAQIVLYLNSDRSTEGPEKFSVELRSGSTTGTILATSSEVTINDTSLSVGANANGLTFGPIRVNRDDGQIANASDWYDICSLDQIPEGGKVAIFVDTSGSMTMGTVSQSYNKLVEKLQEKNITIITVTNSNEDWILPFLTDLS
jgi:hypothetical protein